MNIVLIGYRGSGKSAVGRALAQRLGWPFVDTDSVIERQAGSTIREIFAAQGEAVFRDLEATAIAQVAARDAQVIGAGGGAILRETNVAALRRNAKVVWLTASPEVLWSRIQSDSTTAASRPNLTSSGGLEEVRQVLEQRTPLYESAADLVIDAGVLKPEELAQRIARELQPGGPKI
jgi:shikimate kinase